ncbi:MAG: dihydrodipicolinate synthase family protein [Protaetiibacter sp.]
MDRTDVGWKGYWTALVTPFAEDGRLDTAALAELVQRVVDDGAHGMLVNGSTGEVFVQTPAERRLVAEIAVQATAGRVPVVVGVTAATPGDAAAYVRHAAQIGADGVLSGPPVNARPTEAELYAYYAEAFDASELPAWLYNFPQENGHPISVDQVGRLIEIDNVVAIKQSSPSIADLIGTIERYGDRIRVFGHLLSRLGVALMSSGFGGDGHFGSGMLFGRRMPEFFDHVWAGRLDEARAIADIVDSAMAELLGAREDGFNWAFGGMQPTLKAAMNIAGQPGGYPRPPKLPLSDPSDLAEIRRILTKAGVMS